MCNTFNALYALVLGKQTTVWNCSQLTAALAVRRTGSSRSY